MLSANFVPSLCPIQVFVRGIDLKINWLRQVINNAFDVMSGACGAPVRDVDVCLEDSAFVSSIGAC